MRACFGGLERGGGWDCHKKFHRRIFGFASHAKSTCLHVGKDVLHDLSKVRSTESVIPQTITVTPEKYTHVIGINYNLHKTKASQAPGKTACQFTLYVFIKQIALGLDPNWLAKFKAAIYKTNITINNIHCYKGMGKKL